MGVKLGIFHRLLGYLARGDEIQSELISRGG